MECRSLPQLTEAAHGIFFARKLVDLAGQVLKALLTKNTKFNGAHFRIELEWTMVPRGQMAAHEVRGSGLVLQFFWLEWGTAFWLEQSKLIARKN